MNRVRLRFFTLESIRMMLEEADFEIKGSIKCPTHAKWLKLCNRVLGNLLIDLLAKQYIIVAVKYDGGKTDASCQCDYSQS